VKNALILHGTSSNSQSNWFPWLKTELEKLDYQVWVPDLPGADRPNMERYLKFLLEENEFDFNRESVVIGHSSGAVTILGILQALPKDATVDSCYLVGSFSHVLAEDPDWQVLKGLFTTPFDFEKIAQQAQRLVFIHSQDDPYCPLEQAEELARQTGGELVVTAHDRHFSVGTGGPEYARLPLLLELITDQR